MSTWPLSWGFTPRWYGPRRWRFDDRPSQLRVCPHMVSFDPAADPDGFSRATADAVGVGRREAFGVRQLAAAFFLCANNMSVPIRPHSIAPLIPMVSHALPRMRWALASAKRLECGSLLPLSSYAQTICLSPYGPIRSRR